MLTLKPTDYSVINNPLVTHQAILQCRIPSHTPKPMTDFLQHLASLQSGYLE